MSGGAPLRTPVAGPSCLDRTNINHLLEVASLVAEAMHGKDLDPVIAALLHDAIEDQEVPVSS